MENIFEIAKRLINRSLIEYYFNSEKAYWKKGEYWTLNPLRADGNTGSFSISENGLYSDFASDESGDFIDLISKYFNISKKEAAEKIIADSGGIILDKNIPKEKKEKQEFHGIKITDKEREIELKEAFLEKAKADYNLKDRNGNIFEISKFYTYREFKTKNLLFYIVRYECKELKKAGDGKYKKFSPLALGQDGKIYQKMPVNFKPYPLYKINRIIDNNLPIIIVEGEKCADISIDGFILVTFLGGANRKLDDFDFSPLAKRKVYIWPDNDESGKEIAKKLKNKIPKSEIFNIDILQKPIKWDIADAYKNNENLTEIINILLEEINSRIKNEDIEYDPESAAELFLKERFNVLNLDQFDGIYWRYLEKHHYWERIEFDNIRSDIQIFLKEKGYFKQLELEKKKKITFKNEVTSFIKDHSQGYFKENPFIESTIQPYIHFHNGAIKIIDEGYNFILRSKKNEDYFRKLYPLTCFDFDFKTELKDINFNNIEKKAPTFYYFIKSMIPTDSLENELLPTLRFICQIIAYCISPVKKKPYFFVFYGDENTAKTSLFNLVKTFIGDNFTVSRSIKEIEISRFGTSDLWGSKIYADEDMDENAIIPGGFIKRCSGETAATVERKNENAQKGVKLSIAMFFVSNFKPKAYGIEGIKRRAIMMKFENKVPKRPDADLMNRISGKKPHNYLTPEYDGKIFDEREILIHLIMDEWKRMSENSYEIEMPNWIKKSTDSILSEMTSSSEYLQFASNGDRYNIDTDNIYTIEDIYKDYKEWCKEEGRQPKSKGRFEEEIKRDRSRIDSGVRLNNRRKGVYKILYISIDDIEEKEKEKEFEIKEIPF